MRSRIQRRGVLIALVLATTAAATDSLAQSRKGYSPGVVENGGTIVGAVRLDGQKPAPKRVDVKTKEDVCHKDPIYAEKLVVSGEYMVRWAVVSLQKIQSGKPFSKPESADERPVLDQKGCVFHPHVVVVPFGQPLFVLNSDGVLHNVHTWPKKNRSANMAMPGPVKEMKLRFRRPERIRVTCDIHPWMEAWVVVAEHPYYAVTDEKGRFVLSDVPPGRYTLHLWHETLGEWDQGVTVTPNADTQVDFTVREHK